MSGSSENLLWMQNPELANALRRRQLGETLMKQGVDASPIQSPWQGAARLAQALMGGWEQRKADEEIKGYGEKRQKMAEALMAPYQPGGASPTAPQALPPAQTEEPRTPIAGTALAPPDLAPFITEQAQARGIPPQLATSLFQTESGFNPTARNPRSGAFGIGQVLASTAANPGYGLPPISEADLADPKKAIPWSLDYLKARGGPLGVTDWNDPQQAARGIRAYGENTDEYERKVLGGAGMLVAGPGAPPSPQGQPRGVGTQDFGEAQFYEQQAMRAQQAGMHQEAALLMQRAQRAQQAAIARQPTEMSVVPDPSSPSGYRYVPRGQAGGMPAPPPGPQVSIDQRAPSSFDSERGKDVAQNVRDWNAGAQTAANQMRMLESFREFSKKFPTGIGAETRLTAGSIAQMIGVPKAAMEALGISPDTVAAGEGIRSLANKMTMSALGGAGGFPANNFSDADRNFLTQIFPSLANTPAGNEIIGKIIEANAGRQLEIAQAWRNAIRENGGKITLDLADKFASEVLPKITERDVIVPAAQAGGWMPPAPVTGAEPTAVNPQTGQRMILRGGKWEPVQ